MELTEEQLMIKNTVREFAEKEIEPICEELDDKGEFPMDVIKKMGQLGLMGIPVSVEYGGAGADNISYIIAVEELSRVSGSVGITLAAHFSLGTYPIYAHGSEEQKRKYVSDLASGKKLGSFGLTEPNAGSDAAATETTAVKDGNHYIINGSKIFITNAGYAETFIITAMTDKSKRYHGISAFILEKGMDGFEIGKKEDKLGLRISDTRELSFQDVRVPKENLVGKEGEGFKIFMDTLDGGRISIAALALGIAQGAFERSVKYAKERKQFGKPIAAFGAIQEMIADMATEVTAARLLTYEAARLKDRKLPYDNISAMAKLYASEAAYRITKNAIQVHGGQGYSREYAVERYFRDAKLCEIGEGTSEIQRLVISRHYLRD